MSSGKLTKYTGYYRCTDDISKFSIRIRMKEVDPDSIKMNKEIWHVREFGWQEKYFSKIEQDFYRHSKNCITDLEKKYNEKILNNPKIDSEHGPFLYTYVSEDGYISKYEEPEKKITYLQNMMENMSINIENKDNQGNYDYTTSLMNSIEHVTTNNDFESMYIMIDVGEYMDDVWIRNEHQLCSIKFSESSKLLSIFPDFTTTRPYLKIFLRNSVKHIYYFIENGSTNFSEAKLLKENEIIKKVEDCRRSYRNNIIGDTFFLPPNNKLYVYILFEILSGSHFENNELFIKYSIELPENWNCENKNSLSGVTQTSHSHGEDGLVHYDHNFEVVLQYDLQSLGENAIPKNPYIYFEVISRGTWERYTTEGLTFKSLPVSKPGHYSYNLSCFRFDTRGPYGGLRRFFIGDFSNYKDIRSIGLPEQDPQINVLNKYGMYTIGTGQLNIRLNIIHQSQAFLPEFYEGNQKEKFIYEKLNASGLIRSVNQVLLAFNKARKNLAEVKKNL